MPVKINVGVKYTWGEKMKKYVYLIVIALALLAGCKKQIAEETSIISREEAVQIAQNSACIEEGSLTDDIIYNNYTRTWWIDLDLEKPGCKPACVVDENTKTAEINWRCTGLIAPENE
jgi:hypothetical protein